jgi:hypothetical protein
MFIETESSCNEIAGFQPKFETKNFLVEVFIPAPRGSGSAGFQAPR